VVNQLACPIDLRQSSGHESADSREFSDRPTLRARRKIRGKSVAHYAGDCLIRRRRIGSSPASPNPFNQAEPDANLKASLGLRKTIRMKPSMFNLQVPLPDRNEVFLMNTFTDAQLVVPNDVAALLSRLGSTTSATDSSLTDEEVEVTAELAEHGFIVENREGERDALNAYFGRFREDTNELRVTVLTTLQCNFACDYCFQGDHGDYNKFAAKMSLQTASTVARWIEDRLDDTNAKGFVLTFFGGEPLLNLPVMYELAERAWEASQARGVELRISIITNGLLLTPDVVDRLLPFGLKGVKITLDGDRDTHNRMRPLRGGQGTFDRIVENVRRVADKVAISIGGNFDASSVDSYPALLDFLLEQEFADKLAKVAFKPIIRKQTAKPAKGIIPLMVVSADAKPLGGTCMTSAGAGSSICDTCNFVDEKMSFLREETTKRGFKTIDGVHMGPCEIHKRHAHTIGPDGALYACPGFTGEKTLSIGHIEGRQESWQVSAEQKFEKLAAWKQCGDCAYIPVCAGGCSVASQTELGDMNTPTCHKSSFDSALVSLARNAVSSSLEIVQ
jgi:uncharacterized protein